MNITVVGLGYVGSAYAILLSRKHNVIALDVNQQRVDSINQRISPIGNEMVDEILCNEKLQLKATTDPQEAYEKAELVLIAVNTNLDEKTGVLNTSPIQQVMEVLNAHCAKDYKPMVVLKSTVPTGFTNRLKEKYPQFSFLFSPEFLREKQVMEDVMHPSRIIVGHQNQEQIAQSFINLQKECMEQDDVPTLLTTTKEAEAIKLFSNSYLALRVAFFNELDTFACEKGLDSRTIIQGVCMDPRIGNTYNRPSAGFGGHCLPKDTKQLVHDFEDTPEVLLKAALKANEYRKEYKKK